MSKGQSPKLKETICNVPVNIVRTCNNPLYYDIDINLSDIADYLIQPKVNKTFLNNLNALNHVEPDEPIPLMVETTGCDSRKCCNKEVIQDALNSFNKEYGMSIFVENEMVNKKEKNDVVKELEPIDFKMNSCGQENSHEKGDNIEFRWKYVWW